MLWKITANELTNWADNRVSQGDLPELIRRLIHSTIPSSRISHALIFRQAIPSPARIGTEF